MIFKYNTKNIIYNYWNIKKLWFKNRKIKDYGTFINEKKQVYPFDNHKNFLYFYT